MDEDAAAKEAQERAAAHKARIRALGEDEIDLIFLEARTYRTFQDREVTDATLKELHEIFRLGPTSGNCCPGRHVFVKSAEAKARLEPCLDKGNVAHTMAAPVTAIVAHDLDFHADMAWLAPFMANAAKHFQKNPELEAETAFRNGSLQGAYLMIAARALGLDCGPMSGFDNAKVDAAFFAGTRIRSNFLCNLGYGDPAGLFPRGPRHDFDQVCRIL